MPLSLLIPQRKISLRHWSLLLRHAITSFLSLLRIFTIIIAIFFSHYAVTPPHASQYWILLAATPLPLVITTPLPLLATINTRLLPDIAINIGYMAIRCWWLAILRHCRHGCRGLAIRCCWCCQPLLLTWPLSWPLLPRHITLVTPRYYWWLPGAIIGHCTFFYTYYVIITFSLRHNMMNTHY